MREGRVCECLARTLSTQTSATPAISGLIKEQISRRTLRNILPLRRQSHWERQRRGASGIAKRIPQIPHAGRGGDAGTEDAEAGNGGEAGRKERAVGKRDEGEGVQDLQGRRDGGCGGAFACELEIGDYSREGGGTGVLCKSQVAWR